MRPRFLTGFIKVSILYSSFALSRSSSRVSDGLIARGKCRELFFGGENGRLRSSTLDDFNALGRHQPGFFAWHRRNRFARRARNFTPVEMISIFHPVSFAASRTFCPPRPIASDCSSSATVTVARWSCSSSTTASGVAGRALPLQIPSHRRSTQ